MPTIVGVMASGDAVLEFTQNCVSFRKFRKDFGKVWSFGTWQTKNLAGDFANLLG